MLSRAIRLASLLAAAGAPAAASAQGPVQDDPSRPLVYVFSIDGLDGDAVSAADAPFLSCLLGGQQRSRATLYEERAA